MIMNKVNQLKKLSLALFAVGMFSTSSVFAQDVLTDMVKKPAQVREKLNNAAETRQNNIDNAMNESNNTTSASSGSSMPATTNTTAKQRKPAKAADSASGNTNMNVAPAQSATPVAVPAPVLTPNVMDAPASAPGELKNINGALSMGAAPNSQCGCDPKPVKKPVVKKKKKKAPAPAVIKEEVKPAIEQDGITVGGADMYHVPAGEDGLSKWKTPITYADIEIAYDVNNLPSEQFQIQKKQYIVSLKDKRTGKPLDEYSALNLPGVYSPFSLIRMKSDMSSFETEKNDFKSEDVKEGHIFMFEKPVDKTCEAVSVSLHVKGESNPKTYLSYINKQGEMTNTMSADCDKLKKETRESTFYTPAGNLINLGFAQFALPADDVLAATHRKISYDIHMTHSGREIYPVGYKSFLINKENQQIEFVAPKYDSKGPVFGIGNEKIIPKGDYYLVVGLDTESGEEWLKYKVSVK